MHLYMHAHVLTQNSLAQETCRRDPVAGNLSQKTFCRGSLSQGISQKGSLLQRDPVTGNLLPEILPARGSLLEVSSVRGNLLQREPLVERTCCKYLLAGGMSLREPLAGKMSPREPCCFAILHCFKSLGTDLEQRSGAADQLSCAACSCCF
eukprot:366042-Chlamydomonas_euryale.AAC.6